MQTSITGEDGLHLLDTTAGGRLGGEAPHQPGGAHQHQCTHPHEDEPAGHGAVVQQTMDTGAQSTCLIEQGMERCPDQPGEQTSQGRGKVEPPRRSNRFRASVHAGIHRGWVAFSLALVIGAGYSSAGESLRGL